MLRLDNTRGVRRIRSDYIRRVRSVRLPYRRLIYSVLASSLYTNATVRYKASIKIQTLYHGHSTTSARDLCRITGRSHFVNVKSGLSRLQFKYAASCGLLCGVSRRY